MHQEEFLHPGAFLGYSPLLTINLYAEFSIWRVSCSKIWRN